MQDSSLTPLSYERPGHSPAQGGMFVVRFVVLATLGLMVELAFFVIDVLVWMKLIERYNTFLIPPGMALILLFRLILDGVLIFACLGSLQRRRQTEQWFGWFAKGQFIDAGLCLMQFLVVLLFSGKPMFMDYKGLPLMMVQFAARWATAWVMLAAHQSVYADFYIGTSTSSAENAVPDYELQRPSPRYRVSGVDLRTQKSVAYLSNAKTEPLAKKGAIILGLDARTVVVQAIVDET